MTSYMEHIRNFHEQRISQPRCHGHICPRQLQPGTMPGTVGRGSGRAWSLPLRGSGQGGQAALPRGVETQLHCSGLGTGRDRSLLQLAYARGELVTSVGVSHRTRGVTGTKNVNAARPLPSALLSLSCVTSPQGLASPHCAGLPKASALGL